MKNKNLTVPTHSMQDSIFTIRGVQVLLDRDLGQLYQVEEPEEWKSQIVISNKEVVGIRKMPFAFNEQGASMLAEIPRSNIPFPPLGKIGSSNGNIECANQHE